jgi:hypothetical protein
MNISDVALSYLQAGLSIIPTGADKKPTLPEWGPFRRERPSQEQVTKWFSNGTRNIAVICGAVSGNLEGLDFDCMAEALEVWLAEVHARAPGLLEKLPFESSPKGAHILYRALCSIPGNTKLAMKSVEVAGPGKHSYKGGTPLEAQLENGKWIITPAIIETRGEGGYLVVHPSKGYFGKRGDLCKLPVLTSEEREVLIESARTCNQYFPEPETKYGADTGNKATAKLPGQDFDERGDMRALLQKHGWTFKGHGNDGREKWARPGKENGKASSATLTDGRIFYVFSSNAHPFEAGRGYGPFGVYTLLEQAGDFQAATKALSSQGYGDKPVAKQQSGRKPKFLNVEAMRNEFSGTSKMLYRDDLFPGGEPSLVGGMPGVGKSTDVAAMCKEIVLSDPKHWVLWVATEGFVSDHADKWRKLGMPDWVVMLSDDKGTYKLQLDNWKDREFLDQSLETLKRETGGQVVAVVIDSIRGMQAMGENDPKLASVMSSINSVICDKHKAACIYIAHHKKGAEANRLNKVAGGTGITSSVRAVYAVERVSEYVCKIIPDKSNTLGHNPKTYKSILIEADEGFEVSIVEDANQADDTLKGKAERFLITLFKDATEYEARDIYRMGAGEGLSSRILKKAKESLPIELIHERVGAPWMWRCSLYKENLSPLGKMAKTGDEKANEISKGDKGDKNSGETVKITQGRQEGQGRQEENECIPCKKVNDFNKRDNLNSHILPNIKGPSPDVSMEARLDEGFEF